MLVTIHALLRAALCTGFSIFCSLAGAQAGPCAGGGDARVSAIAAAPSCGDAIRLYKSCAIGASLDGRLAAAVQEKCAARLLEKLTARQREAFERALSACNAKYAQRRGTLYRASSAACRVNVIAEFAGQ